MAFAPFRLHGSGVDQGSHQTCRQRLDDANPPLYRNSWFFPRVPMRCSNDR
jgi:hypothetical protein